MGGRNCTHLEEAREHVGWLTSDDKEAGVELPEVSVQILQTLQEKPEEVGGREREWEG